MMNPQVNDKVTICHYSDRVAARVISRSPKQVKVQVCKQSLANGPNSGAPDALKQYPGGFAAVTVGSQRWDVEDDPEGEVKKFTLRKNGDWAAAGQNDANPNRLVEGWKPYYDFNF